MPKERDPNRELTEKMWLESGGKLNLVEIASQLGISPGTVRGWKNKDNWESKLNGAFQNEERNVPNKRSERSKRQRDWNKSTSEQDDEIDELTDKQRLFVQYYLVNLNATEAAKEAGYSHQTAYSQGQRLLKNVEVLNAIQQAMREREKRIELSQDRVVQQLAKIAFADIKDVVTWDRGSVTIRPSAEVDGTVLAEISETMNDSGSTKKIKLNDRMKALMKLYDHLSDEQRLRIEKLNAEVKALGNPGDESGQNGLDQLAEVIKKSAEAIRGD